MSIASTKELAFLDWLRRHGAVLDKLEWPAVDPATGSRGAIALTDIESGDVVLEIPGALMMTPLDAFNDPVVGPIFLQNRDLLRGDLLITVFLMHERRKKENSFYFSYLDILPELNNLSEWEDDELSLLQDEKLVEKAGSTRRMLKISFAKSIAKLCDMYPVEFPHEEFNFENFLFSWYTIQARAFGRRLPWTALVPFADCLNHKNVQTKYDYKPIDEIGRDKMFRLFLTGNNRYAKGTEAFNSYGRRPNDNLLLEYGFAMLDNEWDVIPVQLSLTKKFNLFDDKVATLCSMRRMISKTFYVNTRNVHGDALHFARLCACDSLKELDLFQRSGWEYGSYCKAISLTNEMKALQIFAEAVTEMLQKNLCNETDLESDLRILTSINRQSARADVAKVIDAVDDYSEIAKNIFSRENRLRPALYYRITRKRIALEIIRKSNILIDILSSIPADLVDDGDSGIKKLPIESVECALVERIGAILALPIVGAVPDACPGEISFKTAEVPFRCIRRDNCDAYFFNVVNGFIDFGESCPDLTDITFEVRPLSVS